MFVLSSNLKYERKTLQERYQRQKTPLFNTISPPQLFSSGVIQPLFKYFQGQEAHYQLKQFMNSFTNSLNNVFGIVWAQHAMLFFIVCNLLLTP